MDKRTRNIYLVVFTVLCAVILLAEIYIRSTDRVKPTSPLHNMMITAGPVLAIGFALVACHDNNNILNRTETPSSAVMIKGFSIQEDQYDLGEQSVVLMRVANYSKRNCIFRISAVYLDADNQVLGRESQSVQGFARGYEKNFLFQPGYTFASFLYSIEDTPCEVVSGEHHYQVTIDKRQLQEEALPAELRLLATYKANAPIRISSTYLLLDDKENMRAMYQGEAVTFPNVPDPVALTATLIFHNTSDGSEHLKRKIVCIHACERL